MLILPVVRSKDERFEPLAIVRSSTNQALAVSDDDVREASMS